MRITSNIVTAKLNLNPICKNQDDKDGSWANYDSWQEEVWGSLLAKASLHLWFFNIKNIYTFLIASQVLLGLKEFQANKRANGPWLPVGPSPVKGRTKSEPCTKSKSNNLVKVWM